MQNCDIKVFKKLCPAFFEEKVYNIDFLKYKNLGFKALIFDIDNTLVKHNEILNDECEKLIKSLKKLDFKIALLSNNDEKRVAPFAKALDVIYIYDAKKPKPDNYIKIISMLNFKKEECLFVGDQLFTDIYGANRAGIKSIFVKSIGKEIYFYIKIKRFFEKIILNLWRITSG